MCLYMCGYVGSLAISSGRAVVQQNKLMQAHNCIGYFQALTPKRLYVMSL